MTALVVGISHRSAPIALLEQLAVDPDGATKLIDDVVANPHVSEATVVATCNRLEIYAAVDRFHGSVEDISGLLLAPAEGSVEALIPHLYVHYDDGAVSHLFRVAAGLDSMAVGEAQVLGQTRDALRLGQEQGSIGPVLNTLFQQALRVGKRAHAETGGKPIAVAPARVELLVRTGAVAARATFRMLARELELAGDVARPHRRRVRALGFVVRRQVKCRAIDRRDPEVVGARRSGDRESDEHDELHRRPRSHDSPPCEILGAWCFARASSARSSCPRRFTA